jgi:PiT family inorganic phosphate transporter
VAHAGFNVLNWDKILLTIGFIPLAPLMGMAVALLLLIAVAWTFRKWRPASVDSLFRKGQFLSAALYSLGHGGNDAQKTMGIIVALLVAAGSMAPDTQLSLSNPETLWIMLGANGAMALGTAFGGWRIVRTMGMKITELKPYGGFCAETAGAFTLFVATHLGVPVSTTHTITGAIVGVGAARGASAVKWGLARRIVWSWILTIPAAALVAAGTYMLTTIFHAR